MKYIVKKTYPFEAAHWLPISQTITEEHKCAKMHGHSYRLTFEVSSSTNAEKSPLIVGMVCDFADISLVVKSVITNILDHKVLNDITGLENPTAENLALWCADLFCHEFRMNFYRPNHPYHKERKDQALKLEAVEVQETQTSFCRLELDRHL